MKDYNITLRQYRKNRINDITITVEGKTIKEVNDRIERYLRVNQNHSETTNTNKNWYIITSHTKISKTKNTLWENFIKFRFNRRN